LKFVSSLFIKSGAACYQARSLWRIECFKIKYEIENRTKKFSFISFLRWYSGFVGWSSLIRLRHITSGLYFAVIADENGKNYYLDIYENFSK